MKQDEMMLNVKNLKKYFPIHAGLLRRVVGYVRAVDGIDLFIRRGRDRRARRRKAAAARLLSAALLPTAGSY